MECDDKDVEEHQISFKEQNAVFTQNNSAYYTLKSDFAHLCKLIDGDNDQINIWKRKFTEAIAEATEKMNTSE
eukprot:2406215-Ditylum_brightwellii.AAC.1